MTRFSSSGSVECAILVSEGVRLVTSDWHRQGRVIPWHGTNTLQTNSIAFPREARPACIAGYPAPGLVSWSFVTVVLTFVGLAWGGAQLIRIAPDVPWLNWIRNHTVESQTPVVTPSPTPTITPSPSPSPSATETYNLVLDASIVVFNSSPDTGLTGAVQTYIQDQSDFAVISAATWTGASPPGNVVRYSTEEFGDSARYLADLLGIATVGIGPTEGAEIAIILVSGLTLGEPPSPTPSTSP